MSRISRSGFNIPGSVPNSQTFELLVSTGISSLDKLLGDGLAVGTITVIEEDLQATYARILLKYFLAEGAVNKHSLFLATQEVDPQDIISHLPALVKEDVDIKISKKDQMKIAFRYTNLPTNDPQIKHEFGHYFDLSATMQQDILENVDTYCWQRKKDIKSNYFNNPAYDDLLNSIKQTLKEGHFFVNDTPETPNILKIGIYGLGSPLWMSDNENATRKDLNKFLLCLKALLRSAFALAVITIPTHLYDKFTIDRCVNTSDTSIRLQALAGTELEHNKYLSDYHGYFHIDKLAAINTFISKHPGPVEYMFKLRRRKFCIEILHLPPDLEISEDKKAVPTLSCSSNMRHLMEF